jgi:exopolysaccharide biosynthesis polyprenyl glycosylphosphotransferase
LFAGDAIAVVSASAASFAVRYEWGFLALSPGPPSPRARLLLGAVWPVLVLVLLAAHRLYDEDTLQYGVAQRILSATVEAVGILSLGAVTFKIGEVPRGWLAANVLLTPTLLAPTRAGTRALLALLRRRGWCRRSAIVITAEGHEAAPLVGGDGEFDVVGCMTPHQFADQLVDVSDGDSEVAVLVRADGLDPSELWDVVLRAGAVGYAVYLSSRLPSLSLDRLAVRRVDGETAVRVLPARLSGRRAVAKRLFDIAFTLAVLPVVTPLAGVAALLILVTSGRPVLFSQDRVGLDGRVFRMWKFRTMDSAAPASGWTVPDDPRRTPVGKFLRRFGLDEIPQFWNVLRGEMSVVGPRPEQVNFAACFARTYGAYPYRHRVKPGITGLAQAHGLRGDTSIEKRLMLDNWYIEHAGILLDLKIIALTLLEVIRGRNAY